MWEAVASWGPPNFSPPPRPSPHIDDPNSWYKFKNLFRIQWHGNPQAYAVWQDESLNMILRSAAERAHRIKFEQRIFAVFGLISALGVNRHIHVPSSA